MIRGETKPLLRFRWLLLVAALLALPAQAAVVAPRDLYEGEIEIDPKAPAEREALMRQALGQVLVRITGERDISKRKAGIELTRMALRLVQQFSYDRRPAPLVKGVAPSVPPAEIKVFRARFDAAALDAQLRERGLPVWGRNRPMTHVWIAVEEGGSRWAATETLAAVDAPSVLQTALARGVPISLPANASANDIQGVVQGANAEVVATAQSTGQRRVLVGRVARKGTQWGSTWSLYDEGKLQDKWQGTAATREEALAFGIDQLASAYAARYALRGGAGAGFTAGLLRLQVSGIDTAGDYARVSRYLAGLNGVSRVELVELADGRALYGLNLGGDRVNLQQSIALSDVLEPEAGATAGADAPLAYRLVK